MSQEGSQRTIRIGGANRDLAIDSLRGVAIILMVAGHVIGDTSAVGMQVPDDSFWRKSWLLLEDLRMPLFTALSGFVYGLRPLRSTAAYPGFVKGKLRRLMVPLISVGLVFVLMQTLIPGTNTSAELGDFWKLFVYGTAHFWFLQAILLIFLLVGAADSFGLLATARQVLVAIALAGAIAIAVQVDGRWAVFSINGAIRLLPFFLLGYLITSQHTWVKRIWSAQRHGLEVTQLLLIGLTILLFGLRAVAVLAPLDYGRYGDKALSVALGVCAISLLLGFRERLGWAPLARLGFFSFAIYLLHVFGTAPTRMMLNRIGVDSDLVVFIVCLAAGLGLPVLFEVTFGRIGWISWLFLGQKPYRN